MWQRNRHAALSTANKEHKASADAETETLKQYSPIQLLGFKEVGQSWEDASSSVGILLEDSLSGQSRGMHAL